MPQKADADPSKSVEPEEMADCAQAEHVQQIDPAKSTESEERDGCQQAATAEMADFAHDEHVQQMDPANVGSAPWAEKNIVSKLPWREERTGERRLGMKWGEDIVPLQR